VKEGLKSRLLSLKKLNAPFIKAILALFVVQQAQHMKYISMVATLYLLLVTRYFISAKKAPIASFVISCNQRLFLMQLKNIL
ncbi:MAG: hypothetical protein LBB91_01680, partial [Clostridiales bacterium]|nr:hypothetical protein [Clostridiales bacterium]